MLKTVIKTSLLVSLAAKILSLFCALGLLVKRVYKDNFICWFWRVLIENLGIYFKHSFIGQILNFPERQEGGRGFLEDSRFAGWVVTAYVLCRADIFKWAGSSGLIEIIGDIKDRIYLSPLNAGGIMVVVAAMANLLFSVLAGRELGLWGWALRSAFLFFGISALFTSARCEDLKKTSHFLRQAQIFIAKF